jgi:hypothetical protein
METATVTAPKLTLAALAALTPANVQGVYSGKPGCACGCKGNYRYHSTQVQAATKRRGYEVTPDEVNDKQVAKVLKIVQEAGAKDRAALSAAAILGIEAPEPKVVVGDSYFSFDVENVDNGNVRVYTIYPAAVN